jgi:glutamate-1-semialdehyde aminotransferase
MKNIVLNSGHRNSNFFFSSEKNDRIFLKEKSYIDLSNCFGSLILGHNNSSCKNKIKEYSNKNIVIFAYQNVHVIKFLKTIKNSKLYKNVSKKNFEII